MVFTIATTNVWADETVDIDEAGNNLIEQADALKLDLASLGSTCSCDTDIEMRDRIAVIDQRIMEITNQVQIFIKFAAAYKQARNDFNAVTPPIDPPGTEPVIPFALFTMSISTNPNVQQQAQILIADWYRTIHDPWVAAHNKYINFDSARTSARESLDDVSDKLVAALPPLLAANQNLRDAIASLKSTPVEEANHTLYMNSAATAIQLSDMKLNSIGFMLVLALNEVTTMQNLTLLE